MSQQKFCTNANSLLEEIKNLKLAFESAYHTANSSGDEEDIKVARDLKVVLEKKMDVLQEELELENRSIYQKRRLDSIVSKENYAVAEIISDKYMHSIHSLQVLPDNRIVVGCSDDAILVWSKNKNGNWSSEFLKNELFGGVTGVVYAFSKDRILSGYCGNSIVMWEKNFGAWSCTEIKGMTDLNNGLVDIQAFRDDEIVVQYQNGSMEVLHKDEKGKWIVEEITGHLNNLSKLTLLLDGRIVFVKNRDIYALHKNESGEWKIQEIGTQRAPLVAMQVLSDGRIVSLDLEGRFYIWSENARGMWGDTIISQLPTDITHFYFLPDNRIITVDNVGNINEIKKNKDGFWEKNVSVLANISKPIRHVQAIPDGRIVFSGGDSCDKIYILDGDRVEG